MFKRIKKFILRKCFKAEMSAIYWAFANIESQINKAHLHKNNKAQEEKAISNFRRAFVSVQTTTKTKRKSIRK